MTAHVAIGTDIIHMHPAASGRALGEGSLRDFRYFVSNVARLDQGVFLNCGSAVILPEVFLKADRAGAQSWRGLYRPHHGQSGFPPSLPAADQRRLASDGQLRARLLAGRSPRDHDSTARGGDRRCGPVRTLAPNGASSRIPCREERGHDNTKSETVIGFRVFAISWQRVAAFAEASATRRGASSVKAAGRRTRTVHAKIKDSGRSSSVG